MAVDCRGNEAHRRTSAEKISMTVSELACACAGRARGDAARDMGGSRACDKRGERGKRTRAKKTAPPSARSGTAARLMIDSISERFKNDIAFGSMHHFATGIVNSAPFSVLSGQRCMIDFCLV
jgi:hypothetical protein